MHSASEHDRPCDSTAVAGAAGHVLGKRSREKQMNISNAQWYLLYVKSDKHHNTYFNKRGSAVRKMCIRSHEHTPTAM